MLRIAILTLLADRDYSGYDLSKAFDASITHVWAASQSQIYPELRKLEENGQICGQDVPQDGRPDKRVYALTDAGRRSLIDWVAEPPTSLTIRDPFQLRAINLGRLPPERASELVCEQRALLRARLTTLEAIASLLEERGHVPGEAWNDQLGSRLTVEAGILTARAYLNWCDWALERLADSAGEASDAP